jgi:hypothetical protein
MNRRFTLQFSLTLLLLWLNPTAARAQAWSGILDPSRAIDWRNVGGATFSIPSGSWTQCTTAACNAVTSAGTSATAAQISSAIQSAPANSFVKLGAGVYNLTGCISWAGHSNTVLRGAGPLLTILKFTGGGCQGYSGNTMIQLQASANTYDQATQNLPGNSNSLSITGTAGTASGGPTGAGLYPQGATQITVSNVGSDAPHVGTILFIDQADDTAPNNGWLQCQSNAAGSACSENGNNNGRKINGNVYEQVQAVRITNISGSTYTISPGLYANNMRSSQTPGAWWNTGSALCAQCGIENLTIDEFGESGVVSGMNIYDCYQCWLKNIRMFWGGGRNDIFLVQSSRVVIRDSYFFKTAGSSSGGGYVIDPVESSDFLVENNIFDQIDNPAVYENAVGTIWGYNYSRANVFVNTNYVIDVLPSHDSGSMMNLWEGNDFSQVSQDTQHGPSPVITYFRNKVSGNQPPPNNKGIFTTPVELQSYNHGINFIGNVLGMAVCSGGTNNGLPVDETSQCPGGTVGGSWQQGYEASPNVGTTNCPNVIYMLGWPTSGCSSSAGNLLQDLGVHNTLVRWGNYDTVNGAVQWNLTEATSTVGVFLPANLSASYFSSLAHTLPASLYYNSKPSWYASAYGNPPWPPVGPDVTGGDFAGLSGHAYRNPARLCYENTPQDSTNYPGTAIIKFDASACYGTGSTGSQPTPPTNLNAIVQ